MSRRKQCSAITKLQLVLPWLLFFSTSAAGIQTKNAFHPIIESVTRPHFHHQYEQKCLQTTFGKTNQCFTTLCATELRIKTQSYNLYL